MKKVGIVYFTKSDVTGELAKSLIEGLRLGNSISIVEHKIQGKEIKEGRFENAKLFKDLESCDCIIFGSPTYMGGPSAQFKAFADASSEVWCEQMWAGKLAAGFTCGSAVNGDQSSTLQYFVTLSSQHGMLWLGIDSAVGYKDQNVNRLGCQLGVVAHSENSQAHETDLATAQYLGKRVTSVLQSLKA